MAVGRRRQRLPLPQAGVHQVRLDLPHPGGQQGHIDGRRLTGDGPAEQGGADPAGDGQPGGHVAEGGAQA